MIGKGNSLVHLYDFGDTFVHQYFLNTNIGFWTDVLESWFCYMKVDEKQEQENKKQVQPFSCME